MCGNQSKGRPRPCSVTRFAACACRFRILLSGRKTCFLPTKKRRRQGIASVGIQPHVLCAAGGCRSHSRLRRALIRLSSGLALLLFVLGINADDHYTALAANDFALLADGLYRRSYFHENIPPSDLVIGGGLRPLGHVGASARLFITNVRYLERQVMRPRVRS